MARRGRNRSARLVAPRTERAGGVPGALPPAPSGAHARIDAFVFAEDHVAEHRDVDVREARALPEAGCVTWLNVAGVTDTATVQTLGEAFGLHPLAVEDIVHPHQRPKVEVFGEHVFVVVQMVTPLPDGAWETEQVSFVLGPHLLLSFQPDATDVFDPVRERLRVSSGRVRTRGADYLLYALLDLVVDSLFTVLEAVGDRIEDLEDDAVGRPASNVQVRIAVLRREMSVLRRSVWPLREVLAVLQREDTPHVDAATRPYLRDAYDHIVQVVDVIESLRDVLASTLDLYLSVLSTRQNEVMKVLTVLGTVFLPLTFLTGLYGMNFDHMPELHWRYGYPALLAVMAVVVVGALAYFRRRRWL